MVDAVRLQQGERFVLPGQGVVTIKSVYSKLDPDVGVPETYLELISPLGLQRDYPAELAHRRGRDLMGRGMARQVLSILANRLAPMTSVQAKMRYRRAEKALTSRDPIEMAKVLREMLIRAQGGGDAPINIPLQEVSLRNLLTEALCSEIGEVLDFPAEGYGDTDCKGAILMMSARMNPAPKSTTVRRYSNVYQDFPTERVASELRMIERTVKRKGTVDDKERRADLQSRQYALLEVVDSRSRRSAR